MYNKEKGPGIYLLKTMFIFSVFIAGICPLAYGQQNKKNELLHSLKDASPVEKVKVYLKIHELELHQNQDSAIHYASMALENFDPRMGEQLEAKILMKLGMAYYLDNQYNKAVTCLLDSKSIQEKNKLYADLARTNNNLALNYEEVGLYEKSVELYHDNIRHFSRVKDTVRLAMTYNNLGIVYEKLNEYDKAYKNYKRSVLLNNGKDKYTLASAYMNLGIIFDFRKNLDSALYYYHIANNHYHSLGYLDYQSDILYNISSMYMNVNRLDSALFYAEKSLEMEKMAGMSNFTVYERLGAIHSRLGRNNSAMQYYQKALELGERSGNKTDYLNLIIELKRHYQSNGDYKKAYEFALKEIQLKEEILGEAKMREIERLEILYEVELKEKEIELLNSELLVKEQNLNISSKNSKLKTLWILVFIALLIILVIFSVSLMKRNAYRKTLLIEKQKLFEKEKVEQQLIIDKTRLKQEKLLKEKELDDQKKKYLQEIIDQKNRELVSVSLANSDKKEVLGTILDRLNSSVDLENILAVKKLIKENVAVTNDWEDLKLHFENVHPKFFQTLNNKAPNLSQLDLKHCAYVKMRISNKEISKILNVNHRSIVIAHYRIKKKLGLSEDVSLVEYIEAL